MEAAEWLADLGAASVCLPVACLEAARDVLVAGEADATRRPPSRQLGAALEPGISGIATQRVYARGQPWGEGEVRTSAGGGVDVQVSLRVSLPSAGTVQLPWYDVDGVRAGVRVGVRVMAGGEAAGLPGFPMVLARLPLQMACRGRGTLTIARPLALGLPYWRAGLDALAAAPRLAWAPCRVAVVLPAFQHVVCAADARWALGDGPHAEHLRGLLAARIGPEARLAISLGLYVTAADAGGAAARGDVLVHTFNTPFAYFVEADGACLAAGILA